MKILTIRSIYYAILTNPQSIHTTNCVSVQGFTVQKRRRTGINSYCADELPSPFGHKSGELTYRAVFGRLFLLLV